jgi:hypothetical protein
MATVTVTSIDLLDAANILMSLYGSCTVAAKSAPLPVSTPPKSSRPSKPGATMLRRTRAPPLACKRVSLRRAAPSPGTTQLQLDSISNVAIETLNKREFVTITFGNEVQKWVAVGAAVHMHPDLCIRADGLSITQMLGRVPQRRRNFRDHTAGVYEWLWLKLFEMTDGAWQHPGVPRDFFEANANAGLFVTLDRFKEGLAALPGADK